MVGGAGLCSIAAQVPRIAAVRAACLRASVPTFINERTDLFLQQVDTGQHAGLIEQAIARARAYQNAGADGFCPGFDGSTSDWALMRGLRNAGKYNAGRATNAD